MCNGKMAKQDVGLSGCDPVWRPVYVKSTYCAHTGHEDMIEQDGVGERDCFLTAFHGSNIHRSSQALLSF